MHKTNRKNTMTIISVVISLLIVAGLTYAWMSQRAAMTYMTVCVAVDALVRANLITPIR